MFYLYIPNGKFYQNNIKHIKLKVNWIFVSDLHLGGYGCHAKEWLKHLKNFHPRTFILNCDFVDI